MIALLANIDAAFAALKQPAPVYMIRRCPECSCKDEHRVNVATKTIECNACGMVWGVRIAKGAK